jgi:hypothetical protein
METEKGRARMDRARRVGLEWIRDRVEIDPERGCWIWQGRVSAKGYGVTSVAGSGPVRIHRLAWELHHGRSLPDGAMALHSCDVRECCNPEHIRPGTALENARDMAERKRGRVARGEAKRRTARLSDARVVLIRLAADAGASIASLARQHGVDRRTVRDVVDCVTWRHVS